ncbi:MAG: hypothetical protein WCR76_00895 [Sphaerochaetaceae bacterium]
MKDKKGCKGIIQKVRDMGPEFQKTIDMLEKRIADFEQPDLIEPASQEVLESERKYMCAPSLTASPIRCTPASCIICEGAKVSCKAKIASAIDVAGKLYYLPLRKDNEKISS